jgi:hypothetical protein
MVISWLILLRMRNVSDIYCRENQNTYFVLSFFFFPKIVPLWDNVEKCGRAVQATDDSMVHALACWMTEATDTHSKYAILLFHGNNGYVNVPQCYVIHYLSC